MANSSFQGMFWSGLSTYLGDPRITRREESLSFALESHGTVARAMSRRWDERDPTKRLAVCFHKHDTTSIRFDRAQVNVFQSLCYANSEKREGTVISE